ncbi:unnamed protein product, partial [Amoebophrya sp. A120]
GRSRRGAGGGACALVCSWSGPYAPGGVTSIHSALGHESARRTCCAAQGHTCVPRGLCVTAPGPARLCVSSVLKRKCSQEGPQNKACQM